MSRSGTLRFFDRGTAAGISRVAGLTAPVG